MALQVTGQIKVERALYEDPYIKVAFIGTRNDKIHLEAFLWENAADYTAGQQPIVSKVYNDVAPNNFGALAGNVAAAMQTRAENYVKAQILQAFSNVSVANV